MHTLTVVIQIGNTDGKLSQNEWAEFAFCMRQIVKENVSCVHFHGGSDWDAPWQNACWVCEISKDQIEKLKDEVSGCRKVWSQTSAAFTTGYTEMI